MEQRKRRRTERKNTERKNTERKNTERKTTKRKKTERPRENRKKTERRNQEKTERNREKPRVKPKEIKGYQYIGRCDMSHGIHFLPSAHDRPPHLWSVARLEQLSVKFLSMAWRLMAVTISAAGQVGNTV